MSGKKFFLDRYKQLGWAFKDTPLKQSIRINNFNAEGKNLERRLAARGISLEKIPFLESGYWVRRSRVSVGATAEYLIGLYSIQEAAAQIPATLFTDVGNKLVLDACAAPGGKTVQLADRMACTGAIVALDIEKHRLTALSNHLERCLVGNTVVYQLDARLASSLKLKFDRILLDVPCSGNFASDKNWFTRRTIMDVERNAKLQRDILAESLKCLRDGGEIVYSTCSLEPEENELNMDWATKNLGLEIEKIDSIGNEGLTSVFGQRLNDSVKLSRRLWPDETQGFYVCKLAKQRKGID